MKAALDPSAASKVAKNLRSWYRVASRNAISPTHTQVVNPLLCHQALERLAPSLERHRGCDIIDISPGVGLWSQHLHDFLQPRRHILAEHDPNLFNPYLKPLLEQPGSRYRWTDKLLKDILADDELLGPSPAIDRSEQNPGLLVNINFSDQSMTHQGLYLAPNAFFTHDYYVSNFGLGSDLFKRGLFRVLAWMPDANKHSLVPRAASSRTRQSIRYEAIAHVKEVAGMPEDAVSSSFHNRDYGVQVEDMEAMRQAETASGLVVPSSRIAAAPLPPATYIHPSVESWKTTEHNEKPKFHDELLSLDSHVQENFPEIYKYYAPSWLSADKRVSTKVVRDADETVKKWVLLNSRARTLHLTYWKGLRMANEQRAIEREWRATSDPGDAKTLTELKRRHEAYATALNKISPKRAMFVRKLNDDYRAYDMQASHWYRRPYNPLIVDRQDFGKAKGFKGSKDLALIDIEPNPDFRRFLDTDVKMHCFDFVVSRLIDAPAKDILSALEAVAPGSVDDFVERVPSLRDHSKGGWYNLKELRVRAMPLNLFYDIALAYEAWDFRLPDDQLSIAVKLSKNESEMPV